MPTPLDVLGALEAFVRNRRAVGLWVGVGLLEVAAVLGYFLVTTARPTEGVRYLVYPFVWINLAGWAVMRTDPTIGTRRQGIVAGTVAVAYFLFVLWIPGLIGPGPPGPGLDVRLAMAAPGWGPILVIESALVRLYLIPFEVIGYAGLAYLVGATVLASARGALSGVLGLATCVGCTVPVLVPLLGILGGPATSLSTTAYAWSYDIGTVVFALTIGLLVWSHDRSTA